MAEALGDVFFETGRFPEAFSLLQPLADANPNVKISLAEYHVRTGDARGAATLLRGLSGLRPEQLLRVGQVYLDAMRPENATRLLRPAANPSTASRDLRVTYGLAQLTAGHYDDAAKTLESVVHSSQDAPPVVHYYLGSALRLSGDLRRLGAAERHLRSATEMVPQDAFFQYELSLARAQLRDWAGAEAALEQAAKLDPTVPEIQRDLARVYRKRKDRLREVLAEARYLRMMDDPQAALRVLETQALLHPDSGELALAISGAQHHAVRFPASVATLRKALAKQPGDPALLWGLFRLLRAIQRYPEALEVIDTLEGQAPDDPAVLEDKADLLERLSRLGEAEALLVRLRDLEPGNPYRSYRLGYFLTLNASQPEKLSLAETSLRKAVAMRPDSSDAQYALGLLLHNDRRFAEAVPHLRRALDLVAAQPDPLRTLARCYLQTGNHKASDECFALLKRVQSRSREKERLQLPVDQLRDLRRSRAALARFHLATGNLKAATQEWERLAHAFPEDRQARSALIGLYGHARRFQRQFEERTAMDAAVENRRP